MSTFIQHVTLIYQYHNLNGIYGNILTILIHYGTHVVVIHFGLSLFESMIALLVVAVVTFTTDFFYYLKLTVLHIIFNVCYLTRVTVDHLVCHLVSSSYYPLANEVAKGYSNATVRPSFRNILVNTLESTSFNGFWPNLVHT